MPQHPKTTIILSPLLLTNATFIFNLFSSPFHFLHIIQALYFPSSRVSLNHYLLHPLTFIPFPQLSYAICKPIVAVTFSTHQMFYVLALLLLQHLTLTLTSDLLPLQLSQLIKKIIFQRLLFLHAVKHKYCWTCFWCLMVSLWVFAVEEHEEVLVSWKKKTFVDFKWSSYVLHKFSGERDKWSFLKQ